MACVATGMEQKVNAKARKIGKKERKETKINRTQIEFEMLFNPFFGPLCRFCHLLSSFQVLPEAQEVAGKGLARRALHQIEEGDDHHSGSRRRWSRGGQFFNR
jgi:hypothetical protein